MECIYNVTDFDARACDSLQTEKIQSALDACFLNGGGKVIIPKGIFLTGGLRLRSNTTLYLESGAILRGSRNHKDYSAYIEDKIEPIDLNSCTDTRRSVNPFSKWNNGLIKVINAENVSIIGENGSFIDGVDCFDPEGENNMRGPHTINVHNVKNLHLEGYTVMNSGNWAHAIFNSEGIIARGLTVYGGHDGFDVRTCDNILIENCEFRTGDDCIAGFDNKNVIIRSSILDCACSALRFGGTDVIIENCQSIAPSSYGFRLSLSDKEKELSMPTHEGCRHTMHTPFQYYCDHRAEIRYAPGNIIIRGCKFENPDALFLHPFDGEHIWCCNRALNSIVFENCEITGLTLPAILCSDPDEPLDFRLKNVKITSKALGADFPILEAKGCKYIELDNVFTEGFDKPYILSDNKENVKLKGLTDIEICCK